MPPDDFEDIRLFLEKIDSKIEEEEGLRLFVDLVNFCNYMDTATQRYFEGKEQDLEDLWIIQFFIFLNRNKMAINTLINMGDPGEPFLRGSYNHSRESR